MTMEKYGVATIDNEKLASMKKIGHCEKCKAPVFGSHADAQKTCDCNAAIVINYGD